MWTQALSKGQELAQDHILSTNPGCTQRFLGGDMFGEPSSLMSPVYMEHVGDMQLLN